MGEMQDEIEGDTEVDLNSHSCCWKSTTRSRLVFYRGLGSEWGVLAIGRESKGAVYDWESGVCEKGEMVFRV